jgi:hypothetical protein
MGHRVVCFYPTEAQHQDLPDHVLDVASTTGRWEDEGWRVGKDGSRFWAHVVFTAVHDAASLLCGFAQVTRDLTQPQRAQAALIQQAQELEQANAELRRSNQELDDFAYIASHDLKERLRGLHNYATIRVYLGRDPRQS